jgi:hypothetical protein
MVQVEKPRRHCKHTLKKLCSSATTPGCTEPCEVNLPCRHACTGKCHDCRATKTHAKCKETCSTKLPCGHLCRGVCGDCLTSGKHEKCKKTVVEKRKRCSHTAVVVCGTLRLPACKEPCGKTLSCRHACKGSCYECRKVGSHPLCKEPVCIASRRLAGLSVSKHIHKHLRTFNYFHIFCGYPSKQSSRLS